MNARTITMLLALALAAHVHGHEADVEDADSGGDLESEWTTWEITCFNDDGRFGFPCRFRHIPDGMADGWVWVSVRRGETLKIGPGLAELCYAGTCRRLRTAISTDAVEASLERDDHAAFSLPYETPDHDVFRIVKRTRRQATVRVGADEARNDPGDETAFYEIEVATTGWFIRGKRIGWGH